MPASTVMVLWVLATQALHFGSEFVDDCIAIPESVLKSFHDVGLGFILADPEVDDVITLSMLAHGYPRVRSDHICARVGTVGRIFCLRCSAANWRGVSPAHTPCMSPEGNDSA
jgi:hypothetical protein